MYLQSFGLVGWRDYSCASYVLCVEFLQRILYRQWRGRLPILVAVADGDDGLHPRLTGGPLGEIAHLVGVIPVQILQQTVK